MTDARLIGLAKLMCSTDWNSESLVESEDFILDQFQGTAFPSDYQCVKVTTRGGLLVSEDGPLPEIFVAKITNEIERTILIEMANRNIPVPKVYGGISNGVVTVLFEELVIGKELYRDENVAHWKSVADVLAKIHAVGIPNFKSERTFERILNDARIACKAEAELNASYNIALEIVKHRAPVLLHGDLFPTNILITDVGKPIFLDWKDCGRGPYVSDLGRLTGMVDRDTLKPFCPFEEIVRETYYEHIKDKVNHDVYLQEFYAGQFLETAAYYSNDWRSPLTNSADREYAMAVRERLCNIAEKLK